MKPTRSPVEELCKRLQPHSAAAPWPAPEPPPWQRRGRRGAPAQTGHCLQGDGQEARRRVLRLRAASTAAGRQCRCMHLHVPSVDALQQRSPMQTMACTRATPLATDCELQRTQPRSASCASAAQPKRRSRAAAGAARLSRSLSTAGQGSQAVEGCMRAASSTAHHGRHTQTRGGPAPSHLTCSRLQQRARQAGVPQLLRDVHDNHKGRVARVLPSYVEVARGRRKKGVQRRRQLSRAGRRPSRQGKLYRASRRAGGGASRRRRLVCRCTSQAADMHRCQPASGQRSRGSPGRCLRRSRPSRCCCSRLGHPPAPPQKTPHQKSSLAPALAAKLHEQRARPGRRRRTQTPWLHACCSRAGQRHPQCSAAQDAQAEQALPLTSSPCGACARPSAASWRWPAAERHGRRHQR